MSLDSFFNPESIAVIGASEDPKKLGYEVFKNLLDFGEKIYPVNKNEEEVLGKKAYKNVSEIEDAVELAVIIVPAEYVPEVIEDFGKNGGKAAVIITGGFREAGREELEKEVLNVAEKHGVRIIGPNTAGVQNTHNRLKATFTREAKKGKIAFLSQSGALGGAMIYKTSARNIGLSKFVNVGNMVDVDFSDLLGYLDGDETTDAITIYMEGVRKGKKFLNSAKQCSKPIIVLKGGKSESGSKATYSHTGSMAGSPRVYDGIFRQAGIITADSFEEMFAMARAFGQPTPRGNKVAILTNAGGGGVLLSDKIDKHGLQLADLGRRTKEELREALPPIASVKNPIDTIASARGEEYEKSVSVIMEDDNVDILIVVHVIPTFTGMSKVEHAEGVIDAVKEKKAVKPIVTSFLADDIAEDSRELLENEGIPCYNSLEAAASGAYALYKYSTGRN